MSGDTPITRPRVSRGVLPMCDRCESSRGLWDSDGDRMNYWRRMRKEKGGSAK